MKEIVNKLESRIAQILAKTVLAAAVASVDDTCVFMVYQPDVPEELLKQE